MWYNPNLDLVNINAYTKCGSILSMRSTDMEWKPNYDGRNDGQTGKQDDGKPKSSIALIFQSGAKIKSIMVANRL